MSEALPSVVMYVGGVQRRVLVDTGCSRSIAHVSCCEKWKKNPVGMIIISGEEWRCEGTGTVLHLSNGSSTVVDVTITTSKPLG